MRHRHDGSFVSASALDAGVVGGQVGPLLRAAALAAWLRVVRSHLEPLRVLPEQVLAGRLACAWAQPRPARQMPGGWEASHVDPISATMTSAVRRSTPGIVQSRASSGENGATTRATPPLNRWIASSR